MSHTSNWPKYQPVKGVDVNFFKSNTKSFTASNITKPKKKRKK